jgi:polyhydroxybutyrate depolymerase
MKAIVASLAVVALLASSAQARPAHAGTRTLSSCGEANAASTSSVSIRVDGVTRSYLMHAPRGAGRRLPLILAFHGRGESPALLEQYSGLDALHAIVVYPRGLPGKGGKLSWSGTPTAAPGVNDVTFARAIVERLGASNCSDPSRVYATGKSDGGGLAAQLACKPLHVVTAIAPVAGAYYPIPGGCRPSRAVAILEFHGTADTVVPYDGSAERGLPNVHAWLQQWTQRDRCSGEDRPHDVAYGIRLHRWSHCDGDSVVEGYRIAGGGHTWPGATTRSGPGETTRAVDATALIARFFNVSLDWRH